MNEAIISIIARMRDEASPEMKNLGKTTQQSAYQVREFKMQLMAVGSALTATGGLLNRIDNPTTKAVSNFLMMAGAVMSSVSAIAYALPQIQKLINSMRAMAATNIMLKALSGPAGWATLAVGLGVGAGATAGMMISNDNSKLITNKYSTVNNKNIYTIPEGWNTLGIGASNISKMIQPAKINTPSIIQNTYIAGSVVTEKQVSEIARRNIINKQQSNGGKSGIQ